MSEKKAQAPRSYGKKCSLPEDAPDFLKQKGNFAQPELVKIIQNQHKQTIARVRAMTGGRPLMTDNGC